MRTAEAGTAVKLEDTHSNSEGWQIWSTRNKSFANKGSSYTKVAFPQSNLPVRRSLIRVQEFD